MKHSMLDKGTESGGFRSDGTGRAGDVSPDADTDASPAATSSIRARANAVAASLSSPTKGGRAMSKKQQKLAEAAKSSRNISLYFAKKQTAERSQDEAEVSEERDVALSDVTTVVPLENVGEGRHSPVSEEAAWSSPVESDTQDVIPEENTTETIIISDDDEEQEENETHKQEMLGLVHDEDASIADAKLTTE